MTKWKSKNVVLFERWSHGEANALRGSLSAWGWGSLLSYVRRRDTGVSSQAEIRMVKNLKSLWSDKELKALGERNLGERVPRALGAVGQNGISTVLPGIEMRSREDKRHWTNCKGDLYQSEPTMGCFVRRLTLLSFYIGFHIKKKNKFTGVTLVDKVTQASNVQVCHTWSVYCVVCSPPNVTPPISI